MGKYIAEIKIQIDLFEAKDSFVAGQMVNDYVTELAKATQSPNVHTELDWSDCDFVIFEEIEEDENVA